MSTPSTSPLPPRHATRGAWLVLTMVMVLVIGGPSGCLVDEEGPPKTIPGYGEDLYTPSSDTTHADGSEPGDTAEPDPCTGGYPAPPYGVSVGTTIEGFELWDHVAQATVNLEDWHCKGGALLVIASAGWCTACKAETGQINALYEEYHDAGLEVVYTLFEDNYGGPVSDAYAAGWESTFETPYRIYVDKEFSLGAYFDKSSTPMNMIVEPTTMQIVYLVTGFDEDAVTGLVEQLLE